MKFRKRIKISRTEGEWEEILQYVPKSDLNIFLKKEIEKLRKRYQTCTECVTVAEGKRVCKFHYPDQDSHDFLNQLSEIMKKPISTVVDELIINPILTRHR